MHSMTGYGRGSAERDGRSLTIELKSVNHRFLDLSFRMPRALGFLEDVARRRLSESLSRGHIDVFASYRNLREDSKAVKVDHPLLSAYLKALDEIAESTGRPDDRSVMRLAQLNDVLVVAEADEDREALQLLLIEALDVAIQQMRAMRALEGESLRRDLIARLDQLEQMTNQIEERYPATIEEYARRLRARVVELMEGATVDEARLMQEVAIMADRSAIAEETVRLRSHIAQLRDVYNDSEPVGRKLDFIVQELNREVNTISSKSQDVPITRLVVSAKAEIEKMREQVQNVE